MAAFIAPLLSGISGLAGLFGGGTQQKNATTQNTSGTQTQSGSTSGSTTPNLSPIQQQLANLFSNGAINQYNQGTDLTGYKQAGLQTINSNSDITNKSISNMLAARGQSFSPAASNPLISARINQGNQQTQFLQSLPLLQRSLQQQNLSGLLSAFSAMPVGQTSSGSTNGTTTSNSTTTGNGAISGNPLAGLFGGAGAGLAATLPLLYGNKPTSPYGLPNDNTAGNYNGEPI